MAGNEMTAREYEVATRPDIVFAEHDGVTLHGDLYLPRGLGKAPVLRSATSVRCSARLSSVTPNGLRANALHAWSRRCRQSKQCAPFSVRLSSAR
jgi:predicted acyl esterase